MRMGAIGVVEEGKLEGRKFIVPSEVYVEKGSLPGGTNYSLACLIHQKFIPNGGCPECKEELQEKEAADKAIGL